MPCSRCGRQFLDEERIASISGSIMGDEHTDAFFLCPACDEYTVLTWRDDFTGIESECASGPVARREGDERVALIGKCSEPWRKTCRCEAHRAYFGGALD